MTGPERRDHAAPSPDGDGGRTVLDAALQAEFRQRILDAGAWLRLTLVRHQGGGAARESLRPLLIRDAVCWQAERVQAGRTTVRNLTAREALAGELDRLLHVPMQVKPNAEAKPDEPRPDAEAQPP